MRKCYRRTSAPQAKCWRWHGQRGQRIGNLLRLAKKIIKNPLVKNLRKMALKELTTWCLWKRCKKKKKIKNKKVKGLLRSDFANSLMNIGSEYGQKDSVQKYYLNR